MQTYEEKLKGNRTWALNEGGYYFERRSYTHFALRRLVKVFEEARIDYAVLDYLAMFFHGYERFTERVQVLITEDGWRRVEELLIDDVRYSRDGRSSVREHETGVRITFRIAGTSVNLRGADEMLYPMPADVSVGIDGLQCVRSPALIGIILATAVGASSYREQGDVQDLIFFLGLPLNMADEVAISVRNAFVELWHSVQGRLTEEDLCNIQRPA